MKKWMFLSPLLAFIMLLIPGRAFSQHKDPCTYIRQDGRRATVCLHEKSDTSSVLQYWIEDSLSSEWEIDAPTYRLCIGDVTGNGIPDIGVGVFKSTRYSRVKGNRLWLFKLFEEQLIRPLLLSSRVGHELMDFDMDTGVYPAQIHTWERDASGDVVEHQYRHKGFQLKYLY